MSAYSTHRRVASAVASRRRHSRGTQGSSGVGLSGSHTLLWVLEWRRDNRSPLECYWSGESVRRTPLECDSSGVAERVRRSRGSSRRAVSFSQKRDGSHARGRGHSQNKRAHCHQHTPHPRPQSFLSFGIPRARRLSDEDGQFTAPFTAAKFNFLMIYAHMWPTSASWLGSILRFSDLEDFRF